MISIIFSSHNGERTLPRMLESFCHLIPPNGGWKIIAINNASTDSTSEILESFQNRLPLLKLSHSKRGKNSALNAGIDYAEGDLVVFTDDDILADKDWLIELVQAADACPQYSIFGGTILPDWPAQPSEWFLENVPLGIAYAVTEADRAAGEVAPIKIWGPNMMVRASVFANEHRFNEAVGPSSGSYKMGSETEFTTRMVALGHKCWFAPKARVSHMIRREQMNQNWLLGRAFRSGRGDFHKYSDASSKVAGIPRWMLRRLFANYARGMIYRCLFLKQKSFKPLWMANYLRGCIYEGNKTKEPSNRTDGSSV